MYEDEGRGINERVVECANRENNALYYSTIVYTKQLLFKLEGYTRLGEEKRSEGVCWLVKLCLKGERDWVVEC
jgi:hypothetical protein